MRTWTRCDSKAFIVRATNPPPKDVFGTYHHKVPVQLGLGQGHRSTRYKGRRIPSQVRAAQGYRLALYGWARQSSMLREATLVHAERATSDEGDDAGHGGSGVDQRTGDQKDHLEYLSRRVQFEEDVVSNYEETDVADFEDDMTLQPQALKSKRKKKTTQAKLKD